MAATWKIIQLDYTVSLDSKTNVVTRNTDHLELQAAHSWYSDSSVSKTAYTDAITAGKAYVAG